MEKKKPTNSNYYFTQETEDAIIRYNASSDPVYRSRLFSKELYYPFYKMIENIIHTFKFYYMDVESVEDLKHEVMSILVEEKLGGFNPENGAKAFSYFQTIIKRWLIQYNNNNYKKLKKVGSFDEVHDSYESNVEDLNMSKIHISSMVDNFVEDCYANFEELFPKEQDKPVADAVLTLFKARHDVEIFKKKALYIYIREITECETPTVTRVINKLRDQFILINRSYIEKGITVEYSLA
jgi:hypothetical protein